MIINCPGCGKKLENDVDVEFTSIRSGSKLRPGCVIYMGDCTKCGLKLDNISLISEEDYISI